MTPTLACQCRNGCSQDLQQDLHHDKHRDEDGRKTDPGEDGQLSQGADTSGEEGADRRDGGEDYGADRMI